MKRHAPEESFDDLPLFSAIEQAEKRAKVGMESAAKYAEHARPGWKDAALEAVRVYARAHPFFLTENVPFVIPPEADPRAVGSVMRAATRAGLIEANGAAPANTSNRSFKTLWKSLVFVRSEQHA